MLYVKSTRHKLTTILDHLDTPLAEAARQELKLIKTVAELSECEIARDEACRIEIALGPPRFAIVRELSGYDLAAQLTIGQPQPKS